MKEPIIVLASMRHKQATNYYILKMYQAISYLNKKIEEQAIHGQYKYTLDCSDFMSMFDLTLETLTNIYNRFLKAGFDIDDNCTFWILRW